MRVLSSIALLSVTACGYADLPTSPAASTAPAGAPASTASIPAIVASAPMDLGTLGGALSFARDVNDFGHVVGYSEDANGSVKPFLWTPSQGMVDLGSLGGPCGIDCRAFAINNFGQVTGQAVTASGEIHAFLWDDGVMHDLGTLGGVFSTGEDINDLGEVTGSSDIDPDFSGLQRAFFLPSGGAMIELPTFGGILGQGKGLNNSSVVVGEANFADATAGADGFRWSPTEGLEALGLQVHGPTVQPRRINDAGDIVGLIRGAGPAAAFLLENGGTFVDLHAEGEFSGFSSATDVNEHGQVALASSDGAMVWSGVDGFVVLPDLGSGLGQASGINHLGVVVGWAGTSGGGIHAVLWETGTMSDQLTTLSEDVAGLVAAGDLTEGQGTALQRRIANATAALDGGRGNAARGMMTGTIRQVQVWVAEGVLSPVDGQRLIAGATVVLDGIE